MGYSCSLASLVKQSFINMRLLVCLLLVGVVSCTSLLRNLPSNADIKYIYKNNKLVEVKVDYSDDLRPIVKSAAVPTPIVQKVVPIAAATAPKPVLKTAGASKQYYKVDDGELERVKPTHVSYSALPKSPAAPVVKSAPAAPAPAPAAAPKPLTIAGPKVVLKQAPAPVAPSVIIKGPQVIYKRGPAPVAAHAPAPAPVVMVKSAPAAPAPAKSPLIKTFYEKDDGELEKINPTHVSYSFVKSAPTPAPVPAPAPVDAPAPVVLYNVPTPIVKAAPLADVEESLEEEEDDDQIVL